MTPNDIEAGTKACIAGNGGIPGIPGIGGIPAGIGIIIPGIAGRGIFAAGGDAMSSGVSLN